MKLLDSYLGKVVTGGSAIALLVIGSLDVFFAVINEMGEIGKGGYTWLQAGTYIGLTIPRRLYELFPTAVLIGSLLGLGALASNSELVAMRAAGIPIAGIIRSVLKAGFVLMIGVIILGELIAPRAEQMAQNIRAAAFDRGLALQGEEGVWARDGNRFLNIRAVLPDQRVFGVRVFELDGERGLKQSITAHSAEFLEDEEQWVMYDVQRSVFTGEGVTTSYAEQETWQRLLSPRLFSVIVVKPEQMSAWALAKYVEYLQENNLDSRRYELAFWIRFTIPLSSLVMLLLAIPFVFTSLRTGGAGQRLFIGVIVGVAFYLVNRSLNFLGLAYGLSPFLSATLPLFLFLGISLIAIRRIH